MKNIALQSIKNILSDRLLVGLIVAVITGAAAYSIFVILSLQPSDLQVAVHYTAFGETNFYRDKWYYLLSFIGFGAVIAFVHTALIVKLFSQGNRQLAIAFAGLSLLILFIATIITLSILKIAFL